MRVCLVVLASLVATAAVADDRGRSAGPGSTTTVPVIGGSNAPAGKWPDAAAIFWSGMQECSGTLIAPTVVLTAGHCNDASLDTILVGTNSLARPQDGERIQVSRRIEYPNSQVSEDVTVLVLAHASKSAPRAIASGWARFDITNGAAIELVGYGAIDKNANMYIDDLQEAQSTITDFDCTAMPGCNGLAKPDGELGAGGMGIDTCPGDSGGPMYLLTDYGNFLAGITSRSYDNATFPCSEGGIYERPDKIVDWIEQAAGVPVSRGPEPTADPIEVAPNGAAETVITTNDPKATDHEFAIATPPAQGVAKVQQGRVRVCADPEATGADTVTVTISDPNDHVRSLDLTIPIAIAGAPAEGTCDVDAFSVGQTAGGCCDSRGGAAGSSIPLALVLAGLYVRRRRV